MKTLILPFLFLLTFVVSCRETDSDETLEKNVASYDLYVAGNENNQACYWKNTVKTILPSSTGLRAASIVLDNSDIYVLGNKYSALTGLTDYTYWKNNVKYNIEQVLGLQPSDDFHFNDIIFKNGDVHILASIKNPSSTSLDDAYQLCYWKNGVKTIIENQHLSFPNLFSQKMQFFNNDLYITSSKNYDPLTYTYDLGYYKNGNYNFISSSKRFRQFFNDGTSLNIITIESNTNLLESYNITSNVFSSLPSFMNNSYFYSMIKDGTDTYLNVGGAYYKNNNLITLPNNNGGYVIYVDFKVLDENIYLIRQKDSEGIVGQKVFINNVEVQSIISNNTNDRFNSITVVPQ